MKVVFQAILFFAISILLCGCPYDSPYGIDATAQQPIDESLIGKWATFVARPAPEPQFKESPVKLIIERRSDLEYDIAITGYIDELRSFRVVENDTIKGTAWLSIIDNHTFLNTTIKGKVYIAEVKRKGNALDILTLAEHFTAKYIKSSASLRTAIGFHYKTRLTPMYDEWFVLKNLQKVN